MNTGDNILILTPSQEELKSTVSYMNNVIQMSKIINMWPETKKSFLYHLKVWFVITYSLLMIASFSVRILENVAYLDSISVLVDFTTAFISATFRYFYVYIKGDKYLLLVSLIHNNFIQCSLFPKENRAVLQKYYRLANKLFSAYCTFVLFWVLQLCTSPLLSYIWKISRLPSGLNETLVQHIEYPVIMKTYAPFDYYTQPNNIVFYIFQFGGYMTLCWIYLSVDCFWYMVIILTIGQFALLKDSIDTITEILSKYECTELPLRGTELESVREAIKHCIKLHQSTREFVLIVKDISSPVILVDALHITISVGFMLLTAVMDINTGDWNRAIYSFEYFITSIIHFFLFNWLGNELAVQEEEVADAIHNIPWYKCPREKPLLLVMSLQARKPYKLSGGGMFKLSLEFFTNTIKAVFSVFTFLLKMVK